MPTPLNSGVRILAATSLFAAAGCNTGPKIPAEGKLQGYRIATTVDHPSARYYLANYLAGKPTDRLLHERLAEIHARLGDALPTRGQLREISREFSLDVGALIFGRQLLRQKGNRELQSQFARNLVAVRAGIGMYPRKDTLIMLVPGYDYVANGHLTGADFARPRRLLERAGYQVHFVALDPLGSVEENAAFVAKDLLAHRHRKVALAGASSAGPAIHLALGKLLAPRETRNVKVWLNPGGILQGSPVLDQFSSGPKGWLFSTVIRFKGWRRASFDSMRTSTSRARFATLSVPPHIASYNYVGLSLSGSVSDFARDKYAMMRGDGPNDGLTLLPDMLAPNSLSILSPTTDHFFAQDPEIDLKTLALLITVLERTLGK